MDNGPVAIPNNDNINPQPRKMCDAEVYAKSCKHQGKHIDVRNLDEFKRYNVSWFSVTYNKQGYLEVDFIVFKDESSYSKKEGIDMTFMES